MRTKNKWAIFIVACVVISVAAIWYSQKETYSKDAVLQEAWDKFELQSFQSGEFQDPDDGNPIIHLDVYDESEIPKVEKFLQKKLSKEDLEKY